MTAIQILEQAKGIAGLVRMGKLSYDEGKEQTKPLLDQYNEAAQKVAKKYGRKWYNLNYAKLLRIY